MLDCTGLYNHNTSAGTNACFGYCSRSGTTADAFADVLACPTACPTAQITVWIALLASCCECRGELGFEWFAVSHEVNIYSALKTQISDQLGLRSSSRFCETSADRRR